MSKALAAPIFIVFLLLLLCIGFYAIIMLYMYVAQPGLLYLPDVPERIPRSTPEDRGLYYEPVTIHTADGIALDGWFVPSSRARGVILFFHGNAGNISHRLDTLEIFNELNFSTLIIDYRGYGRSQGTPSEAGTYSDAEAAWQYLVENRQIKPRQIVLFGRSLGGAIAAYLASRHPPAALVLESTFSSIPDLAADLYPWLPVRKLSRFKYNSHGLLKSISCPVLIVHSMDDEIILYKHGKRLYDEARGPKRFLEIKGGHNDGFLSSKPAYLNGIKNFLEEYSAGNQSDE